MSFLFISCRHKNLFLIKSLIMSSSDKLSSWKEIADYLDVEVRTCQRWEKEFGLPVHRFTNTPRARVFTTKNEIDQWLNRSDLLQNDQGRISNKKNYIIASIFILIIGISALYTSLSHRSEIPANFKIFGTQLVITNSEGAELWRYNTKVQNLWPENRYRNHFQHKCFDDDFNRFPKIIIKDITTNGKQEVLFTVQTEDKTNCGDIYLFDHRGKIIWKYRLGNEMEFGDEKYSGDYAVPGIDIVDLNNDGKNEIFILAEHLYYFPTQLIILNLDGEKTGSYWNSGRITDYAFSDLNHDGVKEIILSGMNNEYLKGFITILSSNKVSGFSPQIKSDYKCKDSNGGSEIYYLLLPRTIIDINTPSRTFVNNIITLNNGNLSFRQVPCLIYFLFDKKFMIQSIRFSDSFMNKIKETEIYKKGNFSPAQYSEELKKKILYYNGKSWVSEVTQSNPW